MSSLERFDASARTWSDRLARLVWCTGIKDQLEALGAWIGVPSEAFPPSQPEQATLFEIPTKGLTLNLHYPFRERAVKVDPNRWIIADVTFDPSRAPLPFGLDAHTETPDSAGQTLGRDRDDFPASVTTTFYLDDDRAITIRFLDGLKGIRSLRVTRLYGSIPFQT